MPPQSSHEKKKRFWPKTLLALGTFVFLVMILEIALRLLGYASELIWYYDPEVGFRFYPNQTRSMVSRAGEILAEARLNQEGFRGPCYPGPKALDTLRIACIGDSFTFGWAVDDESTYPSFLRRDLEKRLGVGRIEIKNFGIPGFNTVNEYRLFRKVVAPWQPDIVILGHVLNDVQPEDVGPPNMDTFLFKLIGRTALLEAFHRHLRNRFSFFRPEYSPEMKKLRRLYQKNEKTILFNPHADIAKPFWNRSLSTLKALVREVEARGARFLLVSFSGRDQTLTLQRARKQGFITLSGEGTHRRLVPAMTQNTPAIEKMLNKALRPQLVLQTLSQDLGIPFLNLLPAYVEIDENPFHPKNPGHPDVVGYRIAAAQIRLALQEQGWL